MKKLLAGFLSVAALTGFTSVFANVSAYPTHAYQASNISGKLKQLSPGLSNFVNIIDYAYDDIAANYSAASTCDTALPDLKTFGSLDTVTNAGMPDTICLQDRSYNVPILPTPQIVVSDTCADIVITQSQKGGSVTATEIPIQCSALSTK